MRKKHLYISLMLSLLLAACSSDEPGLEGNGLQEDSLSEPQRTVVKLVRDFRHTAESAPTNARTKGIPSLDDITIDGIERQHYTVNLGTQSSSYGTASIAGSERATTQPDTAQFDLYTVTFHADTVHGFAIASPDPRLQRVYAYVESGSVADTAFIEPMRWAIEAIPDIAREDIEKQRDLNTAKLAASVTNYNIGPILNTEWHQRAPFNRYTPKCYCDTHKGGNMPIGCVPIAVAQCIAKIGVFQGTYYGNKDINFANLTSTKAPITTAQQDQAASFLHEVAIMCQTKFGCKGSGAPLRAAQHYLEDLNYVCIYSTQRITNFDYLAYLLSAGFPHISVGYDNNSLGHAWVVDGLIQNSSGRLFHCNWGWGGGNGWYSHYYATDNGSTSFPYNYLELYITGISNSSNMKEL